MDTKTCSVCHESFPASPEFFNRDKSRKSGLHPWCKPCSREKKRASTKRVAEREGEAYKERRRRYRRAYRARHPERIKQHERKYGLKRKFGITVEDYDSLLVAQNGQCAVCLSESDTTLHVDHDHTTGAIRGLLCSQCNTGLGLFYDDVDRLRQAIRYLEEAT